MIVEASPLNEHQSVGVVERSVQTNGGVIRTRNLALEQSSSKKLEADHVVFPWLMHAAVLKLAAMGGPLTTDAVANRTGKSYAFSVSASSTFRWTEHEAERASLKRSCSVECI